MASAASGLRRFCRSKIDKLVVLSMFFAASVDTTTTKQSVPKGVISSTPDLYQLPIVVIGNLCSISFCYIGVHNHHSVFVIVVCIRVAR